MCTCRGGNEHYVPDSLPMSTSLINQMIIGYDSDMLRHAHYYPYRLIIHNDKLIKDLSKFFLHLLLIMHFTFTLSRFVIKYI